MTSTVKYRRTFDKTTPKQGGLNAQLAAMPVGGYLYIECTNGNFADLQTRIQQPVSRRPDSMKDMKFKVCAYTAVSTVIGDVKVLVRVERVA